MANNKRIQIQHWYTTGSTAPSGTGLTNMLLGEIAIATQTGKEAIFIKNNDGSAVTFIPKTKIDELISDATTGITSDLTTHETLKGGFSGSQPVFGHTTIVSGDLKNIAGVTDGHAAASFHTHGQYLTGVTTDTSQTIASLIENGVAKIGLTTGIINQINSGVSGYTKIVAHETKSGKAGEIGHVKLVGGDLSGKTGSVADGEAAASHHIHSQYIAKDDISNGLEIDVKGLDKKLSVKAKTDGGITVDANGVSINSGLTKTWNDAAEAINAFLNNEAAISGAVDTLKEINEYLTGTGTSVETLLKTLDDLTDTVDSNTTAITQNSNNILSLTTSASTNASNIKTLGQTIGQVSLDVTTIKNKIGSGFTSGNTITSEIENIKNAQSDFVTGITGSENINATKSDQDRQFTITHTTAGTQKSAITATNTTTGLNFGDTFEFVENIGYDANGHIVSGSTQILKLPKITVQNGLTGATGTNTDNDKGYVIGHANSFGGWNGKSTGITLNFNESFKIPIIDYEEQDGREAPNLSGVDVNGHLKNRGWTLTTFSLPNIISCGTY